MTLYSEFHPVPSPIDELEIIASDEGLVALLWTDDERWEFADTVPEPNAITKQTRVELTEYFAGDRTDFTVPLDLRGTDFQKQVWQSLTEIPFGETVSYGEQANRLGRPTAVRAVASANGKNPVSIVVPCHRVIGTNGKLTGYAGGLDAKAWLLQHESAGERLF